MKNNIRFTLIVLGCLLNIYTIYAQDTLKQREIEITILGGTITANEQLFVSGGSIRDGNLTWQTASLKPAQQTPSGIVFGIIEYKITNKTSDKLNIKYDSICVKVNGIRKDITGQAIIDSKPAYGFGIGYDIEGGNEYIDKIIFTSSTKFINIVTFQYENMPPINIKFKVK